MTIPIDNLSGTASPGKIQRNEEAFRNSEGIAGRFSAKLDGILEADGQVAQARAASLAEAFNLQLLRTTLTLAGDDQSGENQSLPSLFPSRTPTLQELVRTYAADSGEPISSPKADLRETVSTAPEPAQPARPDVAASSSGSGGTWLDPIIAKASRHYGVDIGLIKAVIKAESNFNPAAVSHAGARGLMQLMPATARSLGVADSFDPEQNVMAGTRFLRDLLKRYNGDLDSALAAYNWGPANVDRRPDRLPRETREYLARVRQLYDSYTG